MFTSIKLLVFSYWKFLNAKNILKGLNLSFKSLLFLKQYIFLTDQDFPGLACRSKRRCRCLFRPRKILRPPSKCEWKKFLLKILNDAVLIFFFIPLVDISFLHKILFFKIYFTNQGRCRFRSATVTRRSSKFFQPWGGQTSRVRSHPLRSTPRLFWSWKVLFKINNNF